MQEHDQSNNIQWQLLFKARLPWREKLELLILFSGGLFVMMAGILRCILIVTVLQPAPITPTPFQQLTIPERAQRRLPSRQLGLPRDLRRRRNRQHPNGLPDPPSTHSLGMPVSHFAHHGT